MRETNRRRKHERLILSVQARYPKALHDQRQFFDELITEEWETYKSDAWDYTRRFEVAKLFRRERPARVLDVGCGCGFHDVVMAEYDFVERVDAIDYSAKSTEKADEAYPHSKFSRRVADLASDTPDPEHDMVVSFQVFEHLDDPDVYMRYCLAARKPGGVIAIVTPNRLRFDNRIRSFRNEPLALIDPQHFHEYTVKEIAAIGARHQLQVIDSFGHTMQSLIYPKLTPKPYQRATEYGSRLSFLANVIGVLLR